MCVKGKINIFFSLLEVVIAYLFSSLDYFLSSYKNTYQIHNSKTAYLGNPGPLSGIRTDTSSL
jgi:hypothetical protein